MAMRATPALDAAIAARFKSLERMIGNTPLLALELRFQGRSRVLYAKSEQVNMTGSIKDRMALHILRRAYAQGQIRPGWTIVEATSGNTGIAFAALGRALGHPVIIYMPDWMSRERADLIRSLGAQVIPVSREQDGFLGCLRLADEFAARHSDVFLPQQFSNTANIEAHEATTGPELWWQLHFQSLPVDAFAAGVGTGGTIMGVGRFLRSRNPNVRVHPVEPAESPTLSTGRKVGRHRIQGISDEFVPPIVALEQLDRVISVSDGDAILMAQKLARELGLGVGISSGANFLAALQVQNELGEDAIVATVFPDDNKKYLSTDLLREEPARDQYLTPAVELTGLQASPRACQVCCDVNECTHRLAPA